MSSLSSSPSQPMQMRTLFLSDLHLGNAGSRADLVLAFLQAHRAQIYYLVGDILDLSLPFGSTWGADQQAVIDHLQARHRAGAQVVFVQGNHDPHHAHVPTDMRLNVVPVQRAEHAGADGRRYLVVHGDSADFGPFQHRWLERIGMAADQVLRRVDHGISVMARWAGLTTAGVMPGLMRALNTRLYRQGQHEDQLVQLARDADLDGVICGHFHLPALHTRLGEVYANCGDWLDNFVALGEDFSGKLALLQAVMPVAQVSGARPVLGQKAVGAA
jgi:UDP-2,3-diacylglucosamine pyrophosphatase LpxH